MKVASLDINVHYYWTHFLWKSSILIRNLMKPQFPQIVIHGCAVLSSSFPLCRLFPPTKLSISTPTWAAFLLSTLLSFTMVTSQMQQHRCESFWWNSHWNHLLFSWIENGGIYESLQFAQSNLNSRTTDDYTKKSVMGLNLKVNGMSNTLGAGMQFSLQWCRNRA